MITPNLICLCYYTHEINPTAYIHQTPNPSDPVHATRNYSILIGRPTLCKKCGLTEVPLGSREKPISPNYPDDGTCPYCGANAWTLDCGITKCDKCGNYD